MFGIGNGGEGRKRERDLYWKEMRTEVGGRLVISLLSPGFKGREGKCDSSVRCVTSRRTQTWRNNDSAPFCMS